MLVARFLARGDRADVTRAREMVAEVVETTTSLGMVALRERAERLGERTRLLDEHRSRSLRTTAPEESLTPSPPAGPGLEPSPPTRTLESRFRCEGDLWTIQFQDEVCRLKNSKGLHYLAKLLAHPGREFHALELLAVETASSDQVRAGLHSHDTDRPGMHTRDIGDAGEVLDARAKSDYRRRLRELDEELEEARELGDLGRVERLSEELEALARHLAGAVGLGGRDRRAGSAAERARLNVTRAVKTVLDKLPESSPRLADHLQRSVRTGTFCSYSPDPELRIVWRT
jgi:hypothetical protein